MSDLDSFLLGMWTLDLILQQLRTLYRSMMAWCHGAITFTLTSSLWQNKNLVDSYRHLGVFSDSMFLDIFRKWTIYMFLHSDDVLSLWQAQWKEIHIRVLNIYDEHDLHSNSICFCEHIFIYIYGFSLFENNSCQIELISQLVATVWTSYKQFFFPLCKWWF